MKELKNSVMKNNIALILLAHGSKDLQWKKPFVKIKNELQKEHIFRQIELAFFELDSPSLEDVVHEFEKKNYKTIKIEPLLLANGYHLQKDLPNRLKKLKLQFASLNFSVGTALIDQDLVSNAVASSIINNHLSNKIQWFGFQGESISCSEKIKVLEEGLDEILSDINNFLDDAILMGCSQKLTKQKIISNLQNLQSQYKELRKKEIA
jgi:sirohydrochlorin cobaltochelatase